MTNTWMTLKVANRTIEALDVISLDLVSSEGTLLPGFTAGAHIDVEISPGLIRQYSLCNDPAERTRYQIAVLRDTHSRGGSKSIHDDVNVGSSLRISAPRNHFALTPSCDHAILIAGGIGITPILCMAESLSASSASFEMHYCTRSQERCAFHQRIREAKYRDQVQLYFNDCPETARFNIETLLNNAPAGAHVYVCGPSGFIDHVLGSARRLGIAQEQLHREFFAAEAPTPTMVEQAFEVRLARSGTCLQVPQDKSIAQVLQEHGVEVQLSCEQGVCGTCLTRLLEGQAEHRDYFQTEAEQAANEQIAICCSRSRSPVLVLDI